MPHESPRLRTKLLGWLVVPLAVLLTADGSVTYWVALDFSRRAYDHALVEIARELSLHVRADGATLVLDLPDAARAVLLSDPTDRIFHEISTADGQRVAGDPLPRARHADGMGPQKEVLYDARINDVPVRIAELQVTAPGAPLTMPVVIRVAETEIKRQVLAREILLSVVTPQVLLILIAGLVVWIGVLRGLAPLQLVQRVVAARSPYDRSPVSLSGVPGEVRPLLEAINGLLERLDSVMTAQGRFIADASHQLKTPVAALQAQLDLALRETDPQRTRDSLKLLNSGLERLSRLVSQLLSLARNEPQAAPAVSLQPTDLNAAAFEAARAWVPEALARRIDLGFEGYEGEVSIVADAGRLRELLDNLIDNAVRYTPEGAQVTVRVSAGPIPTITVSDSGPSIPADECARIFQRFYRVPGQTAGGTGLGLAIAKEIARIHCAELRLDEPRNDSGNTFRLTFPPAPVSSGPPACS